MVLNVPLKSLIRYSQLRLCRKMLIHVSSANPAACLVLLRCRSATIYFSNWVEGIEDLKPREVRDWTASLSFKIQNRKARDFVLDMRGNYEFLRTRRVPMARFWMGLERFTYPEIDSHDPAKLINLDCHVSYGEGGEVQKPKVWAKTLRLDPMPLGK